MLRWTKFSKNVFFLICGPIYFVYYQDQQGCLYQQWNPWSLLFNPFYMKNCPIFCVQWKYMLIFLEIRGCRQNKLKAIHLSLFYSVRQTIHALRERMTMVRTSVIYLYCGDCNTNHKRNAINIIHKIHYMYMFSLIFFLLISVKKEIYWIWALFVCVNY